MQRKSLNSLRNLLLGLRLWPHFATERTYWHREAAISVRLGDAKSKSDYKGMLYLQVRLGGFRATFGLNYGYAKKLVSQRYIFNSDTLEDDLDTSWTPPKVGDRVVCIDHEETVSLVEGREYTILAEKWVPSEDYRRGLVRRVIIFPDHKFGYADTRFKTISDPPAPPSDYGFYDGGSDGKI